MLKKNMKPFITVCGIEFTLDHEMEGGFNGVPAGVYTATIDVENTSLIQDYFGKKHGQKDYPSDEFGELSTVTIIKEEGNMVTLDLWYVATNLYEFRRDVKQFLVDIEQMDKKMKCH